MLALIKNNEYLSQHHEGSRLDLPSGTVIMANTTGELPEGYSLHSVADFDPVPEGKQIVSTSVELVGADWKYVHTLEDIHIPTPEELRAQMPDKTPREFRDILTDMGIFPQMVTDAINQIPFDIERQKALNAWEVMTSASRVDPYIDMIGVMFNKTPEQIDAAWIGRL